MIFQKILAIPGISLKKSAVFLTTGKISMGEVSPGDIISEDPNCRITSADGSFAELCVTKPIGPRVVSRRAARLEEDVEDLRQIR